MKLHSLVTVKTTLKALIAVFLVCVLSYYAYEQYLTQILSISVSTVCSPACVNGVCNATTFTCDCEDNFKGSDCSTPSMYIPLCMCLPSF